MYNPVSVPQYTMQNQYPTQAQQLQLLQNQIQALQQSQMANMQHPVQQNSQIQYVNGIDSANAYIMSPNSSVLLMDSNKPRFYVKSSDAAGSCTVKAFDFVEAKPEEAPAPTEYVTKAEFDQLSNKINQYEQMFGETMKPAQKPAEQKGGSK